MVRIRLFQYSDFYISNTYISHTSLRPSVTAVNVLRDDVDEIIGFLLLDIILSSSSNQIQSTQKKYLQLKGDPAIRDHLFNGTRQLSAMDTKIDEESRKEVTEYTINLGRCIFCGYCAEVCPELAITHGGEYENASDQREHFVDYEQMLTPLDTMKAKAQKEFEGFGAITPHEDERVKKTPLSY